MKGVAVLVASLTYASAAYAGWLIGGGHWRGLMLLPTAILGAMALDEWIQVRKAGA
jgi:hypothetical protein